MKARACLGNREGKTNVYCSLCAEALRCRLSSSISRLGPFGSYQRRFMWTFLLLRPEQRIRWDNKMIKLDQAQAPTCPKFNKPRLPAGDERNLTTGDVDEWWKSERCSIALGLIDGNSVLSTHWRVPRCERGRSQKRQRSETIDWPILQ